VLLDLEMPVMDGYETAARLRAMEKEGGRKRCKIIAISSNDDRATMQRARDAGCDEYLVKPAQRETLWQILAGHAAPFAAEEKPAKQKEAGPADPIVVDGDLRSMLPKFLQSRRDMLDEMPLALARRDREAFARLAHKLAGGFLAYGFAWAAAQSKALEADAEQAKIPALLARARAVRAHLDAAKIEFTDLEKSR